MIILIHSSKTMRPAVTTTEVFETPIFIAKTKLLVARQRQLSVGEIIHIMKVSPKLAHATHKLIDAWTDEPQWQRAAMDSFIGDNYSGLQVKTWSSSDRDYANTHLRILSGLYGILRPLDGIYPYRLEMGYKLAGPHFKDLYQFWGEEVARTLSANDVIINLAPVEYSRVITPYIESMRLITPKFLTVNAAGTPTFVTVHGKIARGAFAQWLIKNHITKIDDLKGFAELGYRYDPALSRERAPVYVCQQFGGIGLSVRLT